MKNKRKYLLLLFCFLDLCLNAQKKWKYIVTDSGEKWFASEEAKKIAENVLLYQRNNGGWPKNIEMQLPISEDEKQKLTALKLENKDTTIDNDATTQEMIFLAKIDNQQPDERYKKAFLAGIDYLLKAQYSNGGWPQFYPLIHGYYSDVTYNDDAMVNVLRIFKTIKERGSYYSVEIPRKKIKEIKIAFDKGIRCILKTQYLQNGVLTSWCAQYDPVTLQPAKARSYELPSLSGKESARIVLLLMTVEKPDKKIQQAVESAVSWFEKTKIEGIRLEKFINKEGLSDRRVVKDSTAKPLWARFMDLETNEPYFTDRTGIKRKTLDEISYERRNGYAWYTDEPAEVLKKYKDWKKKLAN